MEKKRKFDEGSALEFASSPSFSNANQQYIDEEADILPNDENDEQEEKELEETLFAARDQLLQLELELKENPNDEGLLKTKKELVEVITLTENLLEVSSKNKTKPSKKSKTYQEPQPLGVGSKCLALYSGDGAWYEAQIDAVPTEETPQYQVTFIGYGNSELVNPDEVAPLPDQDSQDASKTKKEERKLIPIPKNLRILPTDTEAVRLAKKKRIKTIKSLNRKQQLNEEKEAQKDNWKKFTSKLSSGKKTGLSTVKRDSIFRSPDTVTGKVGVTGSGKPLTEIPTFESTSLIKQAIKSRKGQIGTKDNQED